MAEQERLYSIQQLKFIYSKCLSVAEIIKVSEWVSESKESYQIYHLTELAIFAHKKI